MRARFFYFVFLIVIFTSCLERYWPDVDKYDDLLVVDGVLTDGPGPYEVVLTTSSSLDKMSYNPVSAAVVTIADDQGTIERLKETGNGRYETNPEFQTIVGRQYKLFVQTPEGEIYETEYQELKEAPAIDSVYTKVKIKDTRNPNHAVGGVQFYIDVFPNDDEGGFYYWRLEEAYRYHSAFFIDYIYDGKMNESFYPDSVYTCYGQGNRGEFFTYDTKNLQTKDIKQFPLVFVTNETARLSTRYSLLVKQYYINEGAYNFWNGIEKQRGDQGALYSKQPYQIAGNLKNINNPDEPVLGFFVVGGMKEKRIFINRPAEIPGYIFSCQPNEEVIGYLSELDESDYPVYFFETGTGSLASASNYCFDCTLRGGSLEKPDFWEE